MRNIHLVWFRHDLRMTDNRALTAACEDESAIVIGLFVHTPIQSKLHHQSPGGGYFMAQHVKALWSALDAKGIPLITIDSTDFGASVDEVINLINKLSVTSIYFNKQYEINEQLRDKQLIKRLNERLNRINVNTYDDSVLIKPGRVLTLNGEMFRVYTPFRNAFLKELTDQDIHVDTAPKERRLDHPFALNQYQVNSLNVIEAMIDYYKTITPQSVIDAMPKIGEDEAIKRLRGFCENHLTEYGSKRDFPAYDGTSQLSAYLVYGILSPRQCVRRMMLNCPNVFEDKDSGAFCWLNELIWREFYRHLIVMFPFLVKHKPMIAWTDNVKWNNDAKQLEAWKNGQTGYPIVDAAMRQLNQTGWMHNRLRMIVASFLVKDLLIDWRLGEQYFMSKLIDGDFAANNGGWQWAASTGCDAAPYFRIFNPTTQSERFDENGEFIRRFVPELSELSNKAIHAPYEHGFSRSPHYPRPIVVHKEARKQTLAAYELAKNNSEKML
ncbi:deoxyribodipyrimidine photo-lyase [Thorsellia anophelis]|uniref:Deoxyribodipyrimidine photo-lyase n=1 Tax=Thorsellia anophelis DSM 18579 TaxID=1123402 RepID=A0A1I0ANF6_9GAMM|nr:deoxyribodipyrimidine photo-lyase [Thorsellia anophelis]SES95698.1 deoxyribodipyrimidine photo-lyase [Thorsellia anophelis DSM 18579]